MPQRQSYSTPSHNQQEIAMMSTHAVELLRSTAKAQSHNHVPIVLVEMEGEDCMLAWLAFVVRRAASREVVSSSLQICIREITYTRNFHEKASHDGTLLSAGGVLRVGYSDSDVQSAITDTGSTPHNEQHFPLHSM